MNDKIITYRNKSNNPKTNEKRISLVFSMEFLKDTALKLLAVSFPET